MQVSTLIEVVLVSITLGKIGESLLLQHMILSRNSSISNQIILGNMVVQKVPA